MPGKMYITYHFPQIPLDPLVIDAPLYCNDSQSVLTLGDE